MQGRKHQVAGKGCLNCDLRRLAVTNFTNQQHVGVVAQNCPKAPCECETRFFRNLNLVDAAQLVFDRVLNRDDLPNRIVDGIERRIKGRCLAASSRSGDQNNPVGQCQHPLE